MLAKKLIVLIIVILALPSHSYAADYFHGSLGIIGKSDDMLPKSGMNFPFYNVYVYRSKQIKMGALKWMKLNPSSSKKSLVFELTKTKDKIPFHSNDLITESIDVRYLKYFDFTNGFINILKYTHGEDLWIQIDDLRQGWFTNVSWHHFLSTRKGTWKPINKGGLNLRNRPKGKRLFSVPNEKRGQYEISLIELPQGKWAKVKVVYRHPSSCRTEVVIKKKIYIGWMKVLDDQGFPNIWFSQNNCKNGKKSWIVKS